MSVEFRVLVVKKGGMGIGAGGHGGSGRRAGDVDGKEGQGLMLSM